MASDIQIVQEPVDDTDKVPVITNWTPLIGYMLYQDDATTASYYYYKLVLEVFTGTSEVTANSIAVFKQRRNGYSVDVGANKARAFFDLRDIANSVLVDTVFDQNDTGQPFRSIHTLGENTKDKVFSLNGDRNTGESQIIALYIKGYQEYSTTQTKSPGVVTSDTVNDYLYYVKASLPLYTERNTDSEFIQSDAFAVYSPASSTSKFLSDLQKDEFQYTSGLAYRNYVQETDYHTVAFLNDFSSFATNLHFIIVKYYTAGNALISTTNIANINGNGGETPTDGSLIDTERLLYYGCGPANLEAQDVTGDSGAKPSNNANWAYYTIQGANAAVDADTTALYYFIKQDGNCKGFKVRRLAWRNSLGAYDYFNFKMKSTQTINVKRNNYNSMLGTFNKSLWRYNDTQRGKEIQSVSATLKETLNTDWLTEKDGQLLENLINSTNVYLVKNADTTYTEGVIITDTSFIRKSKANDKMIKYTINIEYANPVNTNS